VAHKKGTRTGSVKGREVNTIFVDELICSQPKESTDRAPTYRLEKF